MALGPVFYFLFVMREPMRGARLILQRKFAQTGQVLLAPKAGQSHCREMADFASMIKSRNFTVVVRLETSGRKGKPVTMLEGLPKQELFLKELLKALKAACGAGGTHHMDRREGAVEIQGDQRDKVCAILEKAEMKVSRR